MFARKQLDELKQSAQDSNAFFSAAHAAFHATLFRYPELIQSSEIERIVITQEEVRFVLRSGITLTANPADHRSAPLHILNFGSAEHDELKLCDLLIKSLSRPKIILDVGANIGYFSIALARKNLDARFYAFEPLSKNLHYLRHNIALNAIGNIEIVPLGLSDTTGEVVFYYNEHIMANASLAPLTQGHSSQESATVMPLDLWVREQLDAQPVGLIKIDVEGAEYRVLLGARNVLRTHQPILMVEILRKWSAQHGIRYQDVWELITSEGYRPFIAAGEKLSPIEVLDEKTPQTNFFFLHQEKHRAVMADLAGVG